jgi:hypothetical protein
MTIHVQEASKNLSRQDQNRTSTYVTAKTLSTENKKRILKAAKEKHQVTYEGKPIRKTTDFQQKP